MKFDPKSAESDSVVPEGWYDTDIIGAKDTYSKAGAEMIEVNYKCYHGAKTVFTRDYITAATAFKLKKLCKALGLSEKFNTGTVSAADLQGHSLRLYLVVEEGKGDYPAKMVPKKYEGRGGAAKPVPAAATAAVNDDPDDLEIKEENIPF